MISRHYPEQEFWLEAAAVADLFYHYSLPCGFSIKNWAGRPLLVISMKSQEKTCYERLMRKCIDLANIAKGRGDSPVGAVLARGDEIISEGIEGGKTHQDITFHAEIEAIRNATRVLSRADLSDCIMVTTHEPCIMCSYVIRHHKIKLVIVGLTVGEIGGYSSALPLLLDKSITKWSDPPIIIDGILAAECKALSNKGM